MGFFSDLKEDLSQAVNELLPEEELAGGEPVEKAVQEEEAVKEEAVQTVEEAEAPGAQDLSAMLDRLDSIQIPEEFDAAETVAEFPAPEEAQESGEARQPEMTLEAPAAEPEEYLSAAGFVSEAFKEPQEIEELQEAEEAGLESLLDNVLSSGRFAVAEEQEEGKKGEKEMETNEERNVVDETAVITAGMTVTGDVVSEGSLDVIGTINGNIDVWGKLNVTGSINGNSKAAEIFADSAKISGEVVGAGAVKIGASSVIIGNITATSAVIAGAVKGDIDVRGPVVLDASAIVMGNIKSKSVQINNGAVIEGMCSQCYADVSPTSFFDDYKPEPKKTRSK